MYSVEPGKGIRTLTTACALVSADPSALCTVDSYKDQVWTATAMLARIFSAKHWISDRAMMPNVLALPPPASCACCAMPSNIHHEHVRQTDEPQQDTQQKDRPQGCPKATCKKGGGGVIEDQGGWTITGISSRAVVVVVLYRALIAFPIESGFFNRSPQYY